MEYNKKDPLSIEEYGKKLIGRTMREFMEEKNIIQLDMLDSSKEYGNFENEKKKRNKGNLGQRIEENFFGYKCNSDARPDFPEAGVELKVTPYKRNKDGTLSAKERLILTMIDYFEVVKEEFEESHVWKKSKLILLIYYLYEKEIKFPIDYRIQFVKLFTPPEQDKIIIRRDYEIIVRKIKEGKAHELSESDTLYLGAAPKAANSTVRRHQPYSDIPAKPRAFAFKSSYMTYVLNHYIAKNNVNYETVIKQEVTIDLEAFIIEKLNCLKGHSIEELCEKYEMKNEKTPKNLEALLAYRILGIKGNKAEEFVKANIVVKAIRIGKNNKIKESMSFPTFKFKEIIDENWEESTFGNYLRETRFLFVVYKYDDNNILRLSGGQFWNIPYYDLENEVKNVWEKTVKVLKEGLKIEIRDGKQYNNFPSATENRISHVRPHARNAKDTYELPDGRSYTKQCFWLNNSYIYEQIENRLK